MKSQVLFKLCVVNKYIHLSHVTTKYNAVDINHNSQCGAMQ